MTAVYAKSAKNTGWTSAKSMEAASFCTSMEKYTNKMAIVGIMGVIMMASIIVYVSSFVNGFRLIGGLLLVIQFLCYHVIKNFQAE